MTDQVMADPAPSNIDGQKVVSHSFDHTFGHRIDWGYVAIAVAVIVAVYILFGREVEGEDDDPAGSVAR